MLTRHRKTTVIGLTAALIVSAGVLHRWVRVTRAGHALRYTPLRSPLSDIPDRIGPFTLERDLPLDTDLLRAANVDAYVNRVYEDPVSGRRLLLYAGYWASENTGTGHGPEVCYPAVGWRPEGEPQERIVRFAYGPNTREAAVTLHRFSHAEPEGIERRSVGFTAVVSGAFLGSSRSVYWHRPVIAGGGHYLAQVQVASAASDGAWESTESDIVAFMELALPHLARCLPETVIDESVGNGSLGAD